MLPIANSQTYASEKIISLEQAVALIRKHKQNQKTVGLCHGGFDLLHPGHMKHFELAKNECDVLIVSITADQFVRTRKGSGRPIYSENIRAYAAAAVCWVDLVVISPFEKGHAVINILKPTYYIKGPDYINKKTPGITAEREAIKLAGGFMRYTKEKPMSTTNIIQFVKHKIPEKKILIILDRDGTLIENDDFLGRDEHWRSQIRRQQPVINYLLALQTKYKTKKIVVTNQSGVARGYFPPARVEEIHEHLHQHLSEQGIVIDSWNYCPDVDQKYADEKKGELKFIEQFVKQETTRKPSPVLVYTALKELDQAPEIFDKIIVLGDRQEDKGLAERLAAQFIDVKGKTYEELLQEFS